MPEPSIPEPSTPPIQTPGYSSPLLRIERLSDVIFAASMIMLASTIEIPPAEGFSREEIARFVGDQMPVLGIYAITLLMLAVYWLKHVEHFHHYRGISSSQMWFQIFYLGSVVILPASSAFSALHPQVPEVQILFSANMFLIGLLSYLTWNQARRQGLLDPELDATRALDIGHEALVEPAVMLVAILVTLSAPDYWELTFLLVPLIFVAQSRWKKRRRSEAGAAS